MTSPFLFATGIENSNPTSRNGRASRGCSSFVQGIELRVDGGRLSKLA